MRIIYSFLQNNSCLFQSCWRAVLVTLSMGLQDFEDREVTTLCLEGLKFAVRVACIFGLTVSRLNAVQFSYAYSARIQSISKPYVPLFAFYKQDAAYDTLFDNILLDSVYIKMACASGENMFG